MKSSSIELPWVEPSFKALESGLNGEKEGSFHRMRKDALSILKDKGLPSPALESWRYTNVQSLSSFQPQDGRDVPEWNTKAFAFTSIPDAVVTIRGINGVICSDSEAFSLPKGLHVYSLKSLLENKDKLANSFSSLLDTSEYPLSALNTSFMNDASVVHVEKGVCIEAPIAFEWYTTEGAIAFPRVLLVMEDASQCSFVHSFKGDAKARYLCAPVAEYIVGKEAVCNVMVLQEEGDEATHLSLAAVDQKDKSTFRSVHINFGGLLVRNEIEPSLDGEEIFSELIGLNILNGKQHVDNTTILDHKKPNSESNELYKGVYADTSTGVFNGTIIVQPDAQKTNAIQSNQSLLLSDKASSKSRPQLKIWADDVRCTHGATVGQLEDEALFYLRSRGIGKEKARQMLIAAFVAEVVDSVSCDSLQSILMGKIEERLDTILNSL